MKSPPKPTPIEQPAEPVDNPPDWVKSLPRGSKIIGYKLPPREPLPPKGPPSKITQALIDNLNRNVLLDDQERHKNQGTEYVAELTKAIQRLHNCEAEYFQTIHIREPLQGEAIWEGDVEVFRLSGHPRAGRCYAWSRTAGNDNQETFYVTVLELPPIDSPDAAVKAAAAVSEIKVER